jgi:hypothetical protein
VIFYVQKYAEESDKKGDPFLHPFAGRSRTQSQSAALEETRRARWETPPLALVQSALQFAFAVVTNVGRFAQISQIMFFLNIVVPGERTDYRAQSTVCQAILELATEFCREWRENLMCGSVIAMDGSWSQRRNASHCVVDFIDVASGKILVFEILDKPIGFSDGNYFHSSDEMEVEGVRRIADRWRQDENLNTRIVAYVHDRDGKTRKLLGKLWPGKQELLDPNHVIKSFDRKLNKDRTLNGIKERLRRWFIFRLHMNASTQEKVEHWRNATLHQGIHQGC